MIYLTDGGDCDADGTANGVTVDPSGPATVSNITTTNAAGDNGGCFIQSLLP